MFKKRKDRLFTILVTLIFLFGGYNLVDAKENNNRKLTIMMYWDADNDLESNLLEDIDKIKKSYSGNSNINVIVLIDRTPDGTDESKIFGENFDDTRLYKIENHNTIRISGEKEFPEITTNSNYEANMGDAHTLKKFINYCKTNYPSDKYMLLISDHGNGAKDDSDSEDNMKYKAFCEDQSSTQGNSIDYLYTAEISDVLSKEESVDFLVFDACYMGTSEVAYQYRPGNGNFESKYMVASSAEVAAYGFNYEYIFSKLNEKGDIFSDDELGKLFIDAEKAYMEDKGMINQQLSYFNLSKVETVKKSIDELSKILCKENKKADIEKLRGTGKKVSLIHYFREGLPGNWVRYPYFDLYDLCKNISESKDFSDNIQILAKDAMRNIDDMIIYSYGGRKYLGFEEGKNGISIFLPNGDGIYTDNIIGSTGTHWQFQSWYNSIDTTKINPNLYYGKLKWCLDGQDPKVNSVGNWFELLDCWFDKSNDEKGGVNAYQW